MLPNITSLIKKICKLDQTAHYGDRTIKLPSDHALGMHMNQFVNYDKFVPFLCTHFSPDDWVVDIGANCGDTIASICTKTPELNYIAVEPHPLYASYLTGNMNALKGLYENVIIRKTMIGQQNNGTLIKNHGTATRAETDSKSANHISQERLDDLITEFEINHPGELSRLRLIKIDVDGYDWDVIGSGQSFLSAHKPLVYFECHHSTDDQLEEYKKTFLLMKSWGYSHFFIFDNFGNFFLVESDVHRIYQFLEYVMIQNRGLASRTIYYWDILAADATKEDFCTKVIEQYITRSQKTQKI